MATRSQMRDWLRRRLQEATPAQWTNATLDGYLNEGLHFMQQEILALDPEAFVYVCTANTVATQPLYAKPTNMLGEIRLEYKESAADSYTVLERQTYKYVTALTADADPSYCHQGRYFRLGPVPVNSVVAGIKLTYVPVLEMGDDSDVPDIPLDLHQGIVLYAQIVALGDTAETAEKEKVKEELAVIVGRLPKFYMKTAAETDYFEVPTRVKGYPVELE